MNDQSINQETLTTYVQGFEDIKQCWQNILFTIPGTIPLLPEFGCDLFRYIDKPITESFGKVRNIIIAALERWEPRAKIDKVTRIIDGSNLLVNIEGTQVNTGLPVSAQINITSSSETQLLTNENITPVPVNIVPGVDRYVSAITAAAQAAGTLPTITNENGIYRVTLQRTDGLAPLLLDLGSLAAMKSWTGTLAEYEALSAYDVNTVYHIEEIPT